MNCVLQYNNVSKEYKNGDDVFYALSNINLNIYEGEFVAVVGPSGSGKSTLLHLGAGIDVPSSGNVLLDGRDLSTIGEKENAIIRNSKIGFIYQSYNLFPILNVKENVEYPCFLYKDKNKNASRSTELLKLVGLEKEVRKKPSELSGGQRQRVAIARSLINYPSVVFADEPTAALDKNTASEIMNLLKTINEEMKTTFVFSTHDEKVMSHAKRIIYLEDGKLLNIDE